MTKTVSIIVPCYNEQSTIHLLLDALYQQTYPLSSMEVVIADGGSTDGTRAVIQNWQDAHSDLTIKLVDNPKRIIPAALNAAILASSGEIIVRLDAHSKPQMDYVARSIAGLEEGLGQNVGGAWDIHPSSDHWMARSIAAAAAHPIGVGDARYRHSIQPGLVDTVPFGAFYRQLLDQVGMFDEMLLTNEDYEFNTRIRQNGGKIWFDPQIRSVYYARADLKSLAQQYWRYGYWKWQMLRCYPATIRWRQALPPLFVSGLIVLAILAVFFPLARWALLAVVALYFSILLATGLQQAIIEKDPVFILGFPMAVATMHLTWGTGFLWGMLHPQRRNRDKM